MQNIFNLSNVKNERVGEEKSTTLPHRFFSEKIDRFSSTHTIFFTVFLFLFSSFCLFFTTNTLLYRIFRFYFFIIFFLSAFLLLFLVWISALLLTAIFIFWVCRARTWFLLFWNGAFAFHLTANGFLDCPHLVSCWI